MSKEKQSDDCKNCNTHIEEIKRDLIKSEWWVRDKESDLLELDRDITAKNLYNAGYRKQSVGEWIRKEYNIDGEITVGVVCNRCGANRVAGLGLAKYCYMCGARMKGGAE